MSITSIDTALVKETMAAPLIVPGSHHSVTIDETSGTEVHVFALAGPPTYPQTDFDTDNDFDVEIPLGPVVFVIQGALNLQTKWLDAQVSVRIPILGRFKLGEVHGDPETGLKLGFSLLSGMLYGSIRFFLKDKWLNAELTATIFKKSYGPVSLPLFPTFSRTGATSNFTFPWKAAIQWMSNPTPPQKAQVLAVIAAALIAYNYEFSHEEYKEKAPDGTEKHYHRWNFGPKKKGLMLLNLGSEVDESGAKSVPAKVVSQWNTAVAKAGKYARNEGVKDA